ncbi:MAG: ABC transporter permease subunit, partial [Clostridia bacterium]|nr:ABC transporter permease subunit [Clostridia bacterium]
LTRSAFWTAFGETLFRTIISYVCSLACAIVLATLSYRFKILQNFLSPFVSVVRALPTMAVVLLLVIWFGAKTAPVIVSLLVVMPTLYATILSCLESVDKDLIETCNLYKVRTRDKILRLYIPSVVKNSAMPISSALSLNLKLMVAGEVLAVTARSLGAMMQMASLYYATDELMALTLITVITALLLEFVLHKLILLTIRRKKYGNAR